MLNYENPQQSQEALNLFTPASGNGHSAMTSGSGGQGNVCSADGSSAAIGDKPAGAGEMSQLFGYLTDQVSRSNGQSRSAKSLGTSGLFCSADDKDSPKDDPKQALQRILAKGAAMSPKEAIQARDLLFGMDGDEFRSTLKSAIASGAFVQMLAAMNIWEAIKTVFQLSQQVVVPTTLLRPAKDTIDDDFKRANEIYNSHGIAIKKGPAQVLSEKATKKILGEDESLDEFDTSISDQATQEELALVKENRSAGRVTGYWVPGMTSSRGETLRKSDLKNLLNDRTSVVVNTAARAQDTFAHELGHALGLPHAADDHNLMAGGDNRVISGPGIDKLTPAQLDIILKSLFIEIGKHGGK